MRTSPAGRGILSVESVGEGSVDDDGEDDVDDDGEDDDDDEVDDDGEDDHDDEVDFQSMIMLLSDKTKGSGFSKSSTKLLAVRYSPSPLLNLFLISVRIICSSNPNIKTAPTISFIIQLSTRSCNELTR